MKVRLSELDCATRNALAALYLAGFSDLARLVVASDEPDPEMSFSEAALAVTAVLVQAALVGSVGHDQSLVLAQGLPLANICIEGVPGNEPVYLPPSAVAAHPLFRGWIGADLRSAVEEMLKAGAIWTQITYGAPVFEELQITDYGANVLGAHLRMAWPCKEGHALTVTASFGAAGSEVPLRRVLALQCNSLVDIGCGTPLVDQAARADEAAAASAIKAAASAAGVRVH